MPNGLCCSPRPPEHPRVGYVTALDGVGGAASQADLKPDLTIADPMTKTKKTVVGVIEKFSWAGGVGDPLFFDFWVSEENATQIKSIQLVTPKNSGVTAINFNVLGFDSESKAWFTQLAPQQPLAGTIAGPENPQLNVDLNPTRVSVKDGIDVNVYKVTIAIAPKANQVYALQSANSSTKHVVKSWGLTVGTLAEGAPPPMT